MKNNVIFLLVLCVCCVDSGVDVPGVDSGPKVELVLGEPGSGPAQLNQPYDVAVDSEGNFIVADTFNKRIQVWDKDGDHLYRIGGEGSTQLDFGYVDGVAVDKYDRIIAVDGGGWYPRISFWKVNGEIRLIAAFEDYYTGPGETEHFGGIHSLAVDGYGRIIVPDTEKDKVVILDKHGEYIQGIEHHRTFGLRGSEPKRFKGPSGAAVDSDNRIIILDHGNYRVQVFDEDATFVLEFGEYGSDPGQFINPYDVAVDSKDNIYVGDTCKVHIYDKYGNFVRDFGECGSEPGQFVQVWGLAVDNQDRVAIADLENSRVQVFRL